MHTAQLAGSFASIKLPRRQQIYGTHGLGVIEDPGTGVRLPGTIRGFVEQVDAAVHGLSQDVANQLPALRSANGQAFMTAWAQFTHDWVAWHARHTSSWSTLWGPTMDEARAFADRYNGFEARFTELTGMPPSTPTAVVHDQPGANDFLGVPAGVWLGVGGSVLALGFVAWGLNSYARVAAPMARVRARAA